MARIQQFGQQKSLLYNRRSQTWSHTGPRHLVAFIQGSRIKVENNYWGSYGNDAYYCPTMSSSEKKWYNWGMLLNGLSDLLANLHIRPRKKVEEPKKEEPKKEEPIEPEVVEPRAVITSQTTTETTGGTTTETFNGKWATGTVDGRRYHEYIQFWQFCSAFQCDDPNFDYSKLSSSEKRQFHDAVRAAVLDGATTFNPRVDQTINPTEQIVNFNGHTYTFSKTTYDNLTPTRFWDDETHGSGTGITVGSINGEATPGTATTTTTYTATITRTDAEGNVTTETVTVTGVSNMAEAKAKVASEHGISESNISITS